MSVQSIAPSAFGPSFQFVLIVHWDMRLIFVIILRLVISVSIHKCADRQSLLETALEILF